MSLQPDEVSDTTTLSAEDLEFALSILQEEAGTRPPLLRTLLLVLITWLSFSVFIVGGLLGLSVVWFDLLKGVGLLAASGLSFAVFVILMSRPDNPAMEGADDLKDEVRQRDLTGAAETLWNNLSGNFWTWLGLYLLMAVLAILSGIGLLITNILLSGEPSILALGLIAGPFLALFLEPVPKRI